MLGRSAGPVIENVFSYGLEVADRNGKETWCTDALIENGIPVNRRIDRYLVSICLVVQAPSVPGARQRQPDRPGQPSYLETMSSIVICPQVEFGPRSVVPPRSRKSAPRQKYVDHLVSTLRWQSCASSSQKFVLLKVTFALV